MHTEAPKKLRWGILGTGRMAKRFAKGLAASRTGELAAVGSRDETKARAFGDEFGCRAFGSYEALVASAEVEAVYIALPNRMHLEWILECARAGKHILCEKPLVLNQYEAQTALEAVRYHDVFLMEAFMYRCHPQTRKLRELLASGVIGDVRLIQSSFAFRIGVDYAGSRFANPDGGGAVMDVGCYVTSMARLIAGVRHKEFAAVAHMGPHKVDEQTAASVLYPNGIVASLAAGIETEVSHDLRIWGTEGNIHVPQPWTPGARTAIYVQKTWMPPEEIVIEADGDLYGMEADAVAESLAMREAPDMPLAESLDNAMALDAWRSAIKLRWESEKKGNPRIKPRPRPGHTMRYADVPGVDRPVSRLVHGTLMFQPGLLPLTSAMLDYFVESGGNCLDTAVHYNSEQMVGEWLRLRGLRDEMVVIGKGCHPRKGDLHRVNAEAIREDLLASLKAMGLDYFDIFMLHRDDPQAPVEPVIDELNEHISAGRIKAIGASNWTTARIQRANDYAKAQGLTGFSCSSSNFGLAVTNEEIWPGAHSISGRADEIDWYTREQMPLFAWSSGCQGFFTDRFTPDYTYEWDMTRVWYSDQNFERKARAQALAAELGVTAHEVALAYVLHQPFPTFALVGPWSIDEARSSVEAMQIGLTPDQIEWLDLRRDGRPA